MGCLFILFIISFAVKKLLSLSKSPWFIFVLISIILGVRSKKRLLPFISECVLFSTRAFIVSDLTFKFLICFELIFCVWC